MFLFLGQSLRLIFCSVRCIACRDLALVSQGDPTQKCRERQTFYRLGISVVFCKFGLLAVLHTHMNRARCAIVCPERCRQDASYEMGGPVHAIWCFVHHRAIELLPTRKIVGADIGVPNEVRAVDI